MNGSRGVTRCSVRLVALAIALSGCMGGRARSPDQVDDVLSAAGKVWYDKYCTPCHGPGGAPADAVSSATKAPVDLRTYVKRHGGKFPASEWLDVIVDARPGGVHAEVWRTIQRDQMGVGQDAAARGVLGSIARYVVSIQTK